LIQWPRRHLGAATHVALAYTGYVPKAFSRGAEVRSMKIGQEATVDMRGSPFQGEQGTIVELPDAEGVVVVKLAHIAKFDGADLPPVALHVRIPADHLALGAEPEDPTPPPTDERVGVSATETAADGPGESAGEEA
jgi:hypothetical protein